MTFVYESENRYNVFFGLIESKNSDVCTFIPEEKSRRLSGYTRHSIFEREQLEPEFLNF